MESRHSHCGNLRQPSRNRTMIASLLPTDAQRLLVRQRPERRQVMYQRWEQLLFLHWKWDAGEIQKTLPEGLHVDTWGGAAWLGIVPFYMRAVRPILFN
jgi:uncharacterized protein